jgi:type III protein arginine methyltransferase
MSGVRQTLATATVLCEDTHSHLASRISHLMIDTYQGTRIIGRENMTDTIDEAVRNARYNEVVVLSTADDEGNSTEHVLIPILDSENGGVTWQDASIAMSNDEFDMGIKRHLRTKKWIIPMLNDQHRNKLYASAIEKACEDAMKRFREKGEMLRVFRILDIGSGSGLLAMMGARSALLMQGETHPVTVKVTSVEMASAMKRLCHLTIRENDMEKFIDVDEQHSCDAKFLPFSDVSDDKPLLCTSELLESGLLREGILPAIRDAWTRHLHDNAIIVPKSARVYAQIVEGISVQNYRGPDIMNSDSQIKLNTTGSEYDTLLGGSGFVVPFHAGAFISEPQQSEYTLGMGPTDETEIEKLSFLSDPILALEFDFTSSSRLPPKTGRSLTIKSTAIKSGTAHGVYFWWELNLYDKEIYSTKLGASPWQDHWQQCLFVFADNHENCHRLVESEEFELRASHDETSISFSIVDSSESMYNNPQKKIKIQEQIHRHVSPDRALQLNNVKRLNTLRAGIQFALSKKGFDANCLDLSDFSLCSLIAAKEFCAKNVTSLESSTNNIPMLSALVTQVGNLLPLEGCKFQVVNTYAENLTRSNLFDMDVDIVFAEPYFETLEGWHLQEALNYFYTLRNLTENEMMSDSIVSVPSYASIKVCAIEFSEEVVHSHCGLYSTIIEGFSHECVQEYGLLNSKYDMRFQLAQYKWKRLSEDIEIGILDFQQGVTNIPAKKKAKLKVGTCHAIAIWVDYGIEISDQVYNFISTGDKYHQQAVRFLEEQIHIGETVNMFLEISMTLGSIGSIEDHEFHIRVINDYSKLT